MRKKARHRRTPDQHRRRWEVIGTGMGMAIGGAMAAAFVPGGTPSAHNPVALAASDDAVTDLAQAIDPDSSMAAELAAPAASDDAVTGLAAAAATLPPQVGDIDDAFTQLIAGIDGNAFTADGTPNDILGILANQINTDLANTVYGPEINTIATQIVCADTPSCVDSLSITPLASGDDPFTAALQYWEQLTSAFFVATPGADDYLATLAADADAEVADTVLGPELYTIVEQIISGLSTIG